LVYSSRADWVRNVLAAGSATLELDGDVVDLVEPELVDVERAHALRPEGTSGPPGILRISEFLRMRRAEP
jgi:hypothetical protein